MFMNKIKDTTHSSFNTGNLSNGCKMCVVGKKLVLFITGACPRKCWYCPVSDNKIQHDVIYANESNIFNVDEAINEAKLCNSSGMGVTGGDPLTKVNRVSDYIKAFKKEFGKKFHVHLYTSFDLVNEKNLEILYSSGLDEIRFHPDLNDDSKWNRILLAEKFDWDVGIEIPCIPDMIKETMYVIKYFKDKVDFFNLNELEAADVSKNLVFDKGYKSKDFLSYGIKGSEELAFVIMKKFNDLNIHFCTSRLKNIEQLGNRIKLRAKNIKKDYDIITRGGSLIRGAVYLKKNNNPDYKTHNLEDLKNFLDKSLNNDFDIDIRKNRLLCSKSFIKKNKSYLKNLGLYPAVVEELATSDLFEIEIDFL